MSIKEEQSKVAQRYLKLCCVDLDNALENMGYLHPDDLEELSIGVRKILENMGYLHPDDLEELSIGVRKIQNELQMLLIASKYCNK